jgi:hypothetical protein
MAGAGRLTDQDWSHYDYRHVTFRPARMTARELQAGADWVIAQFYRLDRILWRCGRALLTVGWTPALLSLRLGLTYRYDCKRQGIIGWDPARTQAGSSRWALMAGIRSLWPFQGLLRPLVGRDNAHTHE